MDDTEIIDFQVFGPTPVGWDPATLPNEVVDEDGTPLRVKGFGEPDPRVPARRAPDDPGVVALREHLKANNGIRGLEICTPDEVERAARIYRRDGFVVVRDALDEEHLALFREGLRAPACRRFSRTPVATVASTWRRRVVCRTATATARPPLRGR